MVWIHEEYRAVGDKQSSFFIPRVKVYADSAERPWLGSRSVHSERDERIVLAICNDGEESGVGRANVCAKRRGSLISGRDAQWIAVFPVDRICASGAR